MSELAFVSSKTGRRYKVISFDREAGKVTLIGEAGVQFTETFDKALFQKLGYELQQG
jgi:hypothetical protein